jgi:uncharacterized protein (TIGR02246 family)
MTMQQTHTGQHQGSVDRSLETTLERFTAAFNSFDANQVASFWAEDGTLINPVGNYGKGRAGVERVYGEDARTMLGGSRSKFTITSARSVGDDTVFLDLDHDVENFHRPDGSTGTMKLHVVILARRDGRDWQWLDARPYSFIERPRRVH